MQIHLGSFVIFALSLVIGLFTFLDGIPKDFELKDLKIPAIAYGFLGCCLTTVCLVAHYSKTKTFMGFSKGFWILGTVLSYIVGASINLFID